MDADGGWNSYAALGFVHRLNPLPSGGVEHVEKTKTAAVDERRVGQEYGKIVRDEAGNVVRVEMESGVDVPADIRRKWVAGLGEEGGTSESEYVFFPFARLVRGVGDIDIEHLASRLLAFFSQSGIASSDAGAIHLHIYFQRQR
jgi:Ribosome biogenesis protein Nop16